MTTEQILDLIKNHSDQVDFNQVIEHIGEHYHYTPCRFSNGKADDQVINEAGSNEGSCKIFAFAQLNALSEAQTLACFGDYYRLDVLTRPEADDHQNIRCFMRHGWPGIAFDQPALVRK